MLVILFFGTAYERHESRIIISRRETCFVASVLANAVGKKKINPSTELELMCVGSSTGTLQDARRGAFWYRHDLVETSWKGTLAEALLQCLSLAIRRVEYVPVMQYPESIASSMGLYPKYCAALR